MTNPTMTTIINKVILDPMTPRYVADLIKFDEAALPA